MSRNEAARFEGVHSKRVASLFVSAGKRISMSWVTDILLVCGLEERCSESGEDLGEPPAVVEINDWLERGNWAPLVQLDRYIGLNSEKAFQACAYGAALNRLDAPAFLQFVADRSWQSPDALLLLIKKEEERKFSVYRMGIHGLMLQAG
jgi:hypothetical protein